MAHIQASENSLMQGPQKGRCPSSFQKPANDPLGQQSPLESCGTPVQNSQLVPACELLSRHDWQRFEVSFNVQSCETSVTSE